MTAQRDLLADVEAGQALALRIHNEVIVAANPSLAVRMFAIAALAAEFAVMVSETPQEADDMVEAIADAARSALPSGFEEKARIGGKLQ